MLRENRLEQGARLISTWMSILGQRRSRLPANSWLLGLRATTFEFILASTSGQIFNAIGIVKAMSHKRLNVKAFMAVVLSVLCR